MVERRVAWRCALRIRDDVPPGDRHGCYLGYEVDGTDIDCDLYGSAGEVQRSCATRYSLDLLRSKHLVAQYQYLSRSALGPWTGDVWGGSIPDQPAGSVLCRRAAGGESELLQGDRYAEALCRSQRTGVRPPPFQCRPCAARSMGHLPSSFSRNDYGGESLLAHVRLQRNR